MPTDDDRVAAVRASFAGYRITPYAGPPGTAVAFTVEDAERVLGLMSWPAEPGSPGEPPDPPIGCAP